jgi:hypothetical protein
VNDDVPGAGADEPQTVSILFREPFVRPGTPEAEEAGCLCRFESNMAAAWLSPVPGHEDETIMVINKDCPLHKIISKPMDDALGDL